MVALLPSIVVASVMTSSIVPENKWISAVGLVAGYSGGLMAALFWSERGSWTNAHWKISLNSADSLWVANTETQLSISKGREAYLEIDYHNTNSLTTGLIYVSPAGVTNNINIRLNAQNPETAVWKKIYIELKELITASPNSSNFQQSFSCYLDPGQISTEILIDNIKVVYFN